MLNTLNNIKFLSIKTATPLSLKTVYNHGISISRTKKIKQSQFLYDEIPIRIAKRIMCLQKLPYNFNKMKGIQNIHDDYIDTFNKLIDYKKPKTLDDCYLYAEFLSKIKKKHNNIEFNIANSVKTYNNINITESNINKNKIDILLNEFYTSRIGLNLLVGHHIDIFNDNFNVKKNGMIRFFKIENIINNVMKEINELFKQHCIIIPKINIKILHETEILYVPGHLHYILFELLKNSLEATIRNNSMESVDILCVHKDNGITIKISDKGGGFSRKNINNIYSYFFSESSNNNHDEYDPYNHNIQTPISGFGHGLGLSKLHVDYFGGNLFIIPTNGIGTDTYIMLNSLGESDERIIKTDADYKT